MRNKVHHFVILAFFVTFFVSPLNAETNAMGDNMADMMLDMMDGAGFINKSNFINSRSSESGERMNALNQLQFDQWQKYLNPSSMLGANTLPMYGMGMPGMSGLSAIPGMNAMSMPNTLPGLSQAQSLLTDKKEQMPMNMMKQLWADKQQNKPKSKKADSKVIYPDDYDDYLRWKQLKEQEKSLVKYRVNNYISPYTQVLPIKKKKSDLDGRWLSSTGDIMTIGYGRFKIQQMNDKVYRGDIKSKGHYISMRMSTTKKVRNFEYAIKGNKLALRDEDGKLLLFKKQPSFD